MAEPVIRRLGYACVALGSDATTNRTCRLAAGTPDRLRALIAQNLDGLAGLLAYNQTIGVTFFRISSQVIPFGSHPANALRWWDEFAPRLAEIGAYIRRTGTRHSMHPGQFTVLSSPRPDVVENAIADLEYHSRFLGALGLGAEHKVVIHGGGVYGDKAAASARFVETYERLSERIRARLVLENDERSYSAADILDISRRCGIPIVFDALHDRILPSGPQADEPELLRRCFATWTPADDVPILHFSSQDPTKQPGAHAPWVDPVEYRAFAARTGFSPADCMLEAKQKDLALLQLRQELAG